MLSFKSVIFILGIGLLKAQPVQVVTDQGFNGVVDRKEVGQALRTLLLDEGELGGQFELTGVVEGAHSQVRYHFSRVPLQVDSLVFPGIKNLRPSVAAALFQPLLGSRSESDTRQRFQRSQSAFSFLTSRSTVELARYDREKIAAVILLHPEFTSYVTGLAGANRTPGGEWLTTGEFNLHLENPFQAASISDIHWDQPSERSRNLRLYLKMPFFPGLPFGIKTAFSQHFRKEAFIRQSVSLAATGLSPWGTWNMGLEGETVLPLNRTSGEPSSRIETRKVKVGIQGDRRYRRWMPRQGAFWEAELGLSQVWLNGRSTPGLSYFLTGGRYFNGNNQAVLIKLWGQGQWVRGMTLHRGQQVQFGGVNSLRGFREEEFSANWVLIPSMEWIPLYSHEVQLFTFVDGAFNSAHDFPIGYGLGFRQFKRGVFMEILFGTRIGEKLSEGKIHIRISTVL